MSIECFNESGYDGVNEDLLIDVASFALASMDVSPSVEATITCLDIPTMSELHVQWMDLKGPTDVMSFPMDELSPGFHSTRPDADVPGPAMLGDIVLCPEFAHKQAEAGGHSLSHELALLTTHGCLHLLGYDHATAAQEKQMFTLQNEILANWYDDIARRGEDFPPKPTGKQAFPSAADRVELDARVHAEASADGSIPAIATPLNQHTDDAAETTDSSANKN